MGFTLTEVLTALVVVAVLAAVAIPLWRVHLLRVRRAEAIAALVALQAAQDGFFGRHARYAGAAELERLAPEGLGLSSRTGQGSYNIELQTSEDGLGYLATARATSVNGQSEDGRCVSFTLDQNNRRHAVDSGGDDRSADCWR